MANLARRKIDKWCNELLTLDTAHTRALASTFCPETQSFLTVAIIHDIAGLRVKITESNDRNFALREARKLDLGMRSVLAVEV